MAHEPPRDPFLSLAIRAEGWPCLIVGGGRVGTRKAKSLLASGAKVTVLSPRISATLRRLAHCGKINWLQREYHASHLDAFSLVIASTSDRELNLAIGRDAETRGILACIVSSAETSRVIFPAVWSDGQTAVAVHSSGRRCRHSQAVRDRIAAMLSNAERKRPSPDTLTQRAAPPPCAPLPPAKVYLIGAGPGAADLLSLRGYRALQAADVILADRLVPATFLAELGISASNKRVCHLADAKPRWSQEQINAWLVAEAVAGRTVARLKGGDPFVFGRGDCELECLAAHSIPWEVVPGPTSATAVLTAAGFPLTRRTTGRSFAVTTARIEGGDAAQAFPKADTLVILMGIAALEHIVARLLADGWPPDAPSAVVERGTLAWERRTQGPLCKLAQRANRACLNAPAIVVVGEAARPIDAIQRQPTLLFTGLDPAAFRTLGNLLHWPAQTLLPHPKAASRMAKIAAALRTGKLRWLVFADKQAVTAFFAALIDHRMDARHLHNARFAALGAATAHRLKQHGLFPDVETSESQLGNTLASLSQAKREPILLVQGSHASPSLQRQLQTAAFPVKRLTFCRLSPHPELGRPLPEHDAIYFVSPGGVRAYAAVYGQAAFQREIWCLGAATQQAVAEQGGNAKIVPPTASHLRH